MHLDHLSKWLKKTCLSLLVVLSPSLWTMIYIYIYLLSMHPEKQLSSHYWQSCAVNSPIYVSCYLSKCLALLQGRCCNFACFTNAS